ncbi:hypothetical protein SLA2020_528330 [Shorea laevis]
MATIVCQGPQSCLDSNLIESTTTIRLKLSSPRPHFSQPLELSFKSTFLDANTKQEMEEKCFHEENRRRINNSRTPEMGGWSFLQALSITSQSSKEKTEEENTYVHPMVKRSLSTLSEKSLELCTENLGSETGSDITDDSIFFLSASMEANGVGVVDSPVGEQVKHGQPFGTKKAISRNFPPPLTTISGPESLRMRPHREGGRLVIKAVKVPSQHSLFQAERTHGRLRLSLLKDYSATSFDPEEAADGKCGEVGIEDKKEEEFENDGNYEEEEEDEEEEDEWETDGNSLEMGGEMGIEKFQRAGRCKEGEHENKGLLNWESCWVVT